MATAARLSFGPNDHGRFVVGLDLNAADWVGGYKYEVIDGRLYVSPEANPPHMLVVAWLHELLLDYSRNRREVVNLVSTASRVVVPDREEETIPEPDLALYHDFPRQLRRDQIRWADHTPFLVIEVLSDDREKDLVRNMALYRQVPAIREYWIVDPRVDPVLVGLRVYRRRGRGWQRPLDIAPGGTYTTPLLPGFSLTLDPTSHAD